MSSNTKLVIISDCVNKVNIIKFILFAHIGY